MCENVTDLTENQLGVLPFLIESKSITMSPLPGPAPPAHAFANSRAATASSWRTNPNVNDLKNVPIVEGAITRNPNTDWVAPARNTSV